MGRNRRGRRQSSLRTQGSSFVREREHAQLLAGGQVRSIGVCNFIPKHLEALIVRTDVVPAVNQVELHPFFIQRELRDIAENIDT